MVNYIRLCDSYSHFQLCKLPLYQQVHVEFGLISDLISISRSQQMSVYRIVIYLQSNAIRAISRLPINAECVIGTLYVEKLMITQYLRLPHSQHRQIGQCYLRIFNRYLIHSILIYKHIYTCTLMKLSWRLCTYVYYKQHTHKHTIIYYSLNLIFLLINFASPLAK